MGRGEKKKYFSLFSFLSPPPPGALPLTRPIFSSLWSFNMALSSPDENAPGGGGGNACTSGYEKVKLSFRLVRNQLKPWRRSLEQCWEAISFSN